MFDVSYLYCIINTLLSVSNKMLFGLFVGPFFMNTHILIQFLWVFFSHLSANIFVAEHFLRFIICLLILPT